MAPQIGDIFYGMTRSLSGKVTHPTIKFSDNVAPKSAPEAVQYWYSQTQRPLPSPAHGDIRWITHEDGSTSCVVLPALPNAIAKSPTVIIEPPTDEVSIKQSLAPLQTKFSQPNSASGLDIAKSQSAPSSPGRSSFLGSLIGRRRRSSSNTNVSTPQAPPDSPSLWPHKTWPSKKSSPSSSTTSSTATSPKWETANPGEEDKAFKRIRPITPTKFVASF